jgi:FixJ family two-component response regulator
MTGSLITIVDDDPSIRDSISGLLRSAGYRAESFPSAEVFLGSGVIAKTQCLILDLRMPGMGGLQLQRRLRSEQLYIPIVFVTAHDDSANRRQAMEAGAVEFLCKPFGASALVDAVQAALESRSGPRTPEDAGQWEALTEKRGT